MSEESSDRPAKAKSRKIEPIARWKKVLLGVSVVLMLAGAALRGYAYVRPAGGESPAAETSPQASSHGQAVAPGARGFLPGSPRIDAPTSESGQPSAEQSAVERQLTELEVWSPVMMRLGFSFFAAFCIAYALRIFFKVSVLVFGMAMLLLMGLQYTGLVQVDWSAIDGRYQSAATWLADQFGSFRQFVTGQLPSASAAAAGLFSGFKRK